MGYWKRFYGQPSRTTRGKGPDRPGKGPPDPGPEEGAPEGRKPLRRPPGPLPGQTMFQFPDDEPQAEKD